MVWTVLVRPVGVHPPCVSYKRGYYCLVLSLQRNSGCVFHCEDTTQWVFASSWQQPVVRLVELCDVKDWLFGVGSFPGHVCYSTPLAGYLRYRLFFDTPVSCRLACSQREPLCSLCVVWCGLCVRVCRADSFESVLSTLCVFDTDLVYPIRKNVLSFVSLRFVGSREVMAYTIECCWGKPFVSVCCVYILYTHNMQVECVLRLLAASRNSSKELKE